ncbi:hypothetical protein FisN_14Lh012 [Fistulifera solaris]|uniref:HSF-type DNA-binding domain-containing protein n=1 Tax=Fistulifera solaris TaxID=1519565 RepID=A0A1Z5KHB0_FISSO|nr:hypothetical protein FisN_14Lh012 [Fistulifera solaris]|eukprot:GAX25704.1 hypothetical protein FisN_14Lh012 [Fistulifera solaris]
MLTSADSKGYAHICSWQPHGLSFAIHDRKALVDQVLRLYFQHHMFASFQRQLNLYGFSRVRRRGDDQKTYYHEYFRRDKPGLLNLMRRIPSDAKPAAWRPQQDPDFSSMLQDQPSAKQNSDTNVEQHAVTISESRHHSGVSASQASDISIPNAQASTYESLLSLFQLQAALRQPSSLPFNQALSPVAALLTNQSTPTPGNWNRLEKPTSDLLRPYFSQPPGILPEHQSNALTSDRMAALLHQSIRNNLPLPVSQSLSSSIPQQQLHSMSLDPSTAASVSSPLDNLRFANAIQRNNLLIQQLLQQPTTAEMLNQRRALLLQYLLGAHSEPFTSGTSQQGNDSTEREQR